MKYLVLRDDDGTIHIMWCGMINDETLQQWQSQTTMRWCGCKEHIHGTLLQREEPPTCIPCVANLHEYAESRYGNP